MASKGRGALLPLQNLQNRDAMVFLFSGKAVLVEFCQRLLDQINLFWRRDIRLMRWLYGYPLPQHFHDSTTGC